ncbi:MAG: ATP-binding protein [Bryobacterales bacterium]|nr:ATP-binding protein [Bryobacterales bacterium]
MSPLPFATEFERLPNPFANSAVGSVWDPVNGDVPEIHADLFDLLSRTVDERTQGHHSRCILLYGDAGSGKTHILRRLRLALETRTGTLVPFSWMRMHTSPLLMWRHLRYHLADDLCRREIGGTPQLDHLLDRPDHLAAVGNRDLAVILEHLAARRHTRDARAWLQGRPLPSEALGRLLIAETDNEDEALEDESRQIVLELLQFLQPAVLCLDQLEALQSHPGDREGLFAIGKLLATLHDEAPGTVVIGSVQTGLIGELGTTLSKAEFDRLQPTALRPLQSQEQVKALIRARLATRPELPKLRPALAEELWPIRMEPFAALLGSREGLSARKVFFECELQFRQAQHLPEKNVPLADHLASKFHDATPAAPLDPAVTANILSDGLPRLLHLAGHGTSRENLPRGVDHVSRPKSAGARPLAVVIGNDKTLGLLAKLRRISRTWNPAEQDLVILRDALHPLPGTAIKTREILEDLRKKGARILVPSREALEALEAARRLLADADSGDLTWRGDRVATADVESWIRNNLPDSLRRLTEEINGRGSSPSQPLLLRLTAILSEHKLAAVESLAAALECSPEEVERCASDHPEQLGLCAGPQRVVFEKAFRIRAGRGAARHG